MKTIGGGGSTAATNSTATNFSFSSGSAYSGKPVLPKETPKSKGGKFSFKNPNL